MCLFVLLVCLLVDLLGFDCGVGVWVLVGFGVSCCFLCLVLLLDCGLVDVVILGGWCGLFNLFRLVVYVDWWFLWVFGCLCGWLIIVCFGFECFGLLVVSCVLLFDCLLLGCLI